MFPHYILHRIFEDGADTVLCPTLLALRIRVKKSAIGSVITMLYLPPLCSVWITSWLSSRQGFVLCKQVRGSKYGKV